MSDSVTTEMFPVVLQVILFVCYERFHKSFVTILSLKLCSKLLHLKTSFYLSFTGYIFMLFCRNSFMVCYLYLSISINGFGFLFKLVLNSKSFINANNQQHKRDFL